METPAIKSRCPKGTRRNKKTGNCEKIANVVGPNANVVGQGAKVKSPVTTMKTNKQTGEKTKVSLVFAQQAEQAQAEQAQAEQAQSEQAQAESDPTIEEPTIEEPPTI